jgi:predicted site-specific integrase-resolvase
MSGVYIAAQPRTLINIVQACAIVRRSRRTLYLWMEKGLVEYVQVPSGRRMIYADTLFRKPERS